MKRVVVVGLGILLGSIASLAAAAEPIEKCVPLSSDFDLQRFLRGSTSPVIGMYNDCARAKEFFVDGTRFEVPRCMFCAVSMPRGEHDVKLSPPDDKTSIHIVAP